jgi:predicted PurR-regulated permease PerM
MLTSIFGGLAFFGAWGFILGPLFARLAKEALVMARGDETYDDGIARTESRPASQA